MSTPQTRTVRMSAAHLLPRRRFLGLAAGGAAAAALGGLRVPFVYAADGGTGAAVAGGAGVRRDVFGRTPDGAEVHVYTLTNGRGLEARVMTYGATLLTLSAPDRRGRVEPVTLHLDALADYVKGHPLFGSVVGRYANRIANARFAIGDAEYKLTENAKPHHIHGGRGPDAFHEAVWSAEPVRDPAGVGVGVRLALVSPDGAAGFPGTVRATVTYALSTTDDRLVMAYEATTDKPTHVNLTNHAYWNLAGAGRGDVLGHVLRLTTKRYLVADEKKIPTGEVRDVRGTPMDFTEPTPVGSRIEQVEGQNYDHCYVLDKERSEKEKSEREGPDRLALAARVSEPTSGRVMEVYTTQPGVQVYTAKGLTDRLRGGGRPYGPYHGLCLETQHYPDAPNRPAFPSTLLRPGQTLREVTEHRFGVEG